MESAREAGGERQGGRKTFCGMRKALCRMRDTLCGTREAMDAIDAGPLTVEQRFRFYMNSGAKVQGLGTSIVEQRFRV